jgi:hypothetical protein
MKKRIVLAIIALLLIFSVCTLVVDYKLAIKEKRPIFAIKSAVYKDGGTTIYNGFGYRITDYNQIDGRNDIQFISPFFFKSIKEKSFKDND